MTTRIKAPALIALGMLLGLALAGGVVLANANFTMSLTNGSPGSDSQVDVITWAYGQYDTAGHPVYTTAQLWLANDLQSKFLEWKNRRMLLRQQIVGAPAGFICVSIWPGLSTGNKNAICAATGESNGCTPCDAAGN